MGVVRDLRQGFVSLVNRTFADGEVVGVKDPYDAVQARINSGQLISTGNAWSVSYNGEKNSGELGQIIDYRPNYAALRIRSWQSYIESEITKTVIDRYVTWVVGTGLKLQASPNLTVLETEDVNEFTKEGRNAFAVAVEARFKVWSGARFSTMAGNHALTEDEKEVLKGALLGGDMLVIMRLVKGQVKVQVIDGEHVVTPLGRNESLDVATGNRIVNGVEIDKNGKHIAYHVKTAAGNLFKTERVEATGKKTQQRLAFMVYGSRYRVDSVRGMPLVSVVLETLKKLERYKEATVGSAEERAKIVYQIVHNIESTGESPLLKRLATANDVDGGVNGLPVDINGDKLARTVAVSTDKQTFNMAQGSELKSLESKVEINFKDFYDSNFDIICAALGIPPNVARMLYDDNFSASRAALKDWENSLRVLREKFSKQFNAPVYEFWLWVQVLSGKVIAKGYLNALIKRNEMSVAAFNLSRWIGAPVPHIDPLKEAKAEREKLGSLGKDVPLTTVEKATESLGTGEADENFLRFAEELAQADELGLTTPEPLPPVAPATEPNTTTKKPKKEGSED